MFIVSFFIYFFNSVFLCFLDFTYELTESDFYVLLICDTCLHVKKNKKQKQKQITAYETLNNFSKSSMLLRKVLIKEAYSGHVHIISYKFWFHFTKYTFPSIFMLSVSLKNFEHYFNVLMEKITI